MMFEWTFEFGWFEDYEVEIPVMSGGIYAITKRWFVESGERKLFLGILHIHASIQRHPLAVC